MKATVKRRGLRRCTAAELRRVGVEIGSGPGYWLSCTSCLMCWSPMIRRGGKNPKGYWKCPMGCNQP
jgi:hypothetical protein